MRYKGYNIIKDTKLNIERGTFEDLGYLVYVPFSKTELAWPSHFENIQSAKAYVDSIIHIEESKHYAPVHYSQYWWTVEDHTTALYARDENNKLILFHTRREAVDWCEKHN